MLRFFKHATLFAAALTLTMACNDDDDAMMPEMPGGMLQANDQVLNQNRVMLSSVQLDEAGWVVVHKDNGSGAPLVPDIVSEPLALDAGTHTNVMVSLNEDIMLEEGESLWLMLHNDAGQMGTYEFSANDQTDAPLTDEDGNIVMTSIQVMSPMIRTEAQAVDGHTVTIAEVTAATDGWLVIHNDDGTGNPVLPGIIGKTFVSAGTSENVMIELTEEVSPGQLLFPMLHVDDPANGEYDFPENGDAPAVFGQDIIMVNFEVLAPSGTFEVSDQQISQNMLSIPSVSVSGKSWLVVHKDNGNGGPVVPEIVSVPKQVEMGTTTDVQLMLNEDIMLEENETLWVMLHTDNGVLGEYEFDGQNGFDGPVTQNGMIVMKAVMVSPASIRAEDQAVTNNQVSIAEVNATTDGWLVIHNDDGTGNPVIPEIIGKVFVEAGTTTDVVVTLDENVSLSPGQKLFPMLHVDSPANGEYDFPENGDAPEVFGQSIIMVNFTVL